MEIERKWLMEGFPTMPSVAQFLITQGYININPEVRIRAKVNVKKSDINHKLCIKSDGDLTRIEVEKNLNLEEYKQLKSMINKKMIYKDYRVYDFDGYKLEVSCVDFGIFYYAEIEFESEEEANSFIAPSWFGKEITYDKLYKMKNYFNNKGE